MNPYQVLGVTETASDEEIRAAYLKLVKKYHPDRYQDNPLKNLADEKLKEVNEAYDTITKGRSKGKTASGGASSGWNTNTSGSYSYGAGAQDGGSSSSYSGQYAAEFQRVRQCLSRQALNEAASILDGIPLKNAEWYYLYALVYYRSGQYSAAYDYITRATNMDPNKVEYRQAYNVMTARGSRSYHSYGSGSGDTANTACNVCTTLFCCDSCCECMGGDLIRCC